MNVVPYGTSYSEEQDVSPTIKKETQTNNFFIIIILAILKLFLSHIW